MIHKLNKTTWVIIAASRRGNNVQLSGLARKKMG